MCGILGTIDLPFSGDHLDALRHRGPDDSGTVEFNVGGHQVKLGHRRLSIVDLSPAGHQPMLTTSGRHAIVFNGEVYNHAELRADLAEMAFRGHSDTETVLYTLAERGPLALEKFNGIFGLAFLDRPGRKLLLARDPFGIKPLYYWATEASFVFSSELRPVQQIVRDGVDPACIAELLRLRYLPAPDTLFKNIRKVRPGHMVEVDLSGPQVRVRETPYVSAADTASSPVSAAEAQEKYGFLLDQAVQRQLMSDVDVGLLLSGGVDSALIGRFAQARSPYRMKAFTVGFSEQDRADEVEDARDTADAIGLEHYHVRIGASDFLETVARITAIVEEPLATDSVVPMYHLSALASRHVKVVLSGQGADEALGGYRRYQAEVLRSYVPRFAVAPLKMASRIAPGPAALARGIDALGETDDVRRFLRVYSVFNEQEIKSLTGFDETRAAARIDYFFELLQCSKRKRSVERMMSLDLRMNLADDLLLYTDKITMHHSMECRVPLLDRDLVAFVETLPAEYRVRPLRGKLIHKQFAKSVLPGRIAARKKKGFLTPLRSWITTGTAVRDVLLDRGSRFSSYFDLGVVLKVLKEHAGGLNRERQIFLLLSIHNWLSQYA